MDDKYLSKGQYKDEAQYHISIVKKCKYGIVELGVLHGDTTRIFLENSNVPVYGIDPIIPDSMDDKLIGNLHKIKSLQESFDRFEFIQDYSYNVVGDWNKKFDYIFIDADHRYDYVKRDFEEWFPLLEQGGVVSLHDSAANRGGPYWWDGPSQLADELLNDSRVEYLNTVFTMTSFKKL